MSISYLTRAPHSVPPAQGVKVKSCSKSGNPEMSSATQRPRDKALSRAHPIRLNIFPHFLRFSTPLQLNPIPKEQYTPRTGLCLHHLRLTRLGSFPTPAIVPLPSLKEHPAQIPLATPRVDTDYVPNQSPERMSPLHLYHNRLLPSDSSQVHALTCYHSLKLHRPVWFSFCTSAGRGQNMDRHTCPELTYSWSPQRMVN